MKELHEKLAVLGAPQIQNILNSLRGQLSALRSIGFHGAAFTDERLLWPLLWLVLHRGNNLFQQRNSERYSYQSLYTHAEGTNVGTVNYQEEESPFTVYGFAGYSRIDEMMPPRLRTLGFCR